MRKEKNVVVFEKVRYVNRGLRARKGNHFRIQNEGITSGDIVIKRTRFFITP